MDASNQDSGLLAAHPHPSIPTLNRQLVTIASCEPPIPPCTSTPPNQPTNNTKPLQWIHILCRVVSWVMIRLHRSCFAVLFKVRGSKFHHPHPFITSLSLQAILLARPAGASILSLNPRLSARSWNLPRPSCNVTRRECRGNTQIWN